MLENIDRLDRRILETLQQEGGLTNQELANRIGLSASPCSRRVKNLEKAGIIQQRVTLLNPDKIGLPVTLIILIRMDRQYPEWLDQFEHTVSTYEEVVECSLVTGGDCDYLIKIKVPDMEYYQYFLLEKLNKVKGIAHIQTSFVIRKVISKTALPLTHI